MNKNLNYKSIIDFVVYSHKFWRSNLDCLPHRSLAYVFFIGVFTLSTISCKKLVEIPEPTSTITTSKAFSSDAIATQAMSGVYYYMINNGELTLTRGGLTIYAGLSSDELILFDFGNGEALDFYENHISASNNQLAPVLWNSPFSNLYHANAVIEGLNNSTTVSDSVRKELTAEAKFVRAFINFNLVNLFGAIPYITTTDWRKSGLLSRTPTPQVYQNIISDLKDAQLNLQADYSVGNGQRIVPNKLAATALLSRTYLYLDDWANAEAQATEVLNSSLYSLEPILNDVFKPNSREAIWQLQQDNQAFSFNGTGEGITLIPFTFPTFSLPPFAYISDSLIGAFSSNDNRMSSWINNVLAFGSNYSYPYKYKIGPLQAAPNGAFTEYYMVLRLAEQYLIRAEARAKQDKLVEAIADINAIHQRAGLSPLSNSLTQQQVLDAIIQERRLELFAEWGHRWLDLKRWGKADAVLGPIKGSNWQPTDNLYPIPQLELQTDPNLTQNPGY